MSDGGLCAALAAQAGGKSVLVIENQALVGGSTAMSGGVIWAPNNFLMRAARAEDSVWGHIAGAHGVGAGPAPLSSSFPSEN